jgi:hypothetical protein
LEFFRGDPVEHRPGNVRILSELRTSSQMMIGGQS